MIATTLSRHHCHGFKHAHNEQKLDLVIFLVLVLESKARYFFPTQKDELKNYMYADSLEKLKLDEDGKIGYTYKCMGTGFWALRQHDFRASIEAITFEVITVCFFLFASSS